MIIKLEVTCEPCELPMKLDGDVETDAGDFVCDKCGARVSVGISGSN